jgi:hypothetical protein
MKTNLEGTAPFMAVFDVASQSLHVRFRRFHGQARRNVGQPSLTRANYANILKAFWETNAW